MIDPALYLIPVPLSDATRPAEVLPQLVLDIVGQLNYFAVENVRSARRFIKSVDHGADISSMHFDVLDEHTAPTDVPAMLEPLRQGIPMLFRSAGNSESLCREPPGIYRERAGSHAGTAQRA